MYPDPLGKTSADSEETNITSIIAGELNATKWERDCYVCARKQMYYERFLTQMLYVKDAAPDSVHLSSGLRLPEGLLPMYAAGGEEMDLAECQVHLGDSIALFRPYQALWPRGKVDVI